MYNNCKLKTGSRQWSFFIVPFSSMNMNAGPIDDQTKLEFCHYQDANVTNGVTKRISLLLLKFILVLQFGFDCFGFTTKMTYVNLELELKNE